MSCAREALAIALSVMVAPMVANASDVTDAATLLSAESPSAPAGAAATSAPSPTPAARAEPHLRAGWAAYRRGQLPAALLEYQRAAESQPEDATVWYDLGCLRLLSGDPSSAQAALRRALALAPHSAAMHDALGQARQQAGDLAGAEQAYTAALAVDPRHTNALWHASRLRMHRKDTAGAREALTRLIEVDPSNEEAMYYLAVLELHADQLDEAAGHFRQVVAQRQDHALAWNGLALATARLGRFDEATHAMDTARQLAPNDARTAFHDGVVAAYQQRWDAARVAWRRAQELDPQLTIAADHLAQFSPQP